MVVKFSPFILFILVFTGTAFAQKEMNKPNRSQTAIPEEMVLIPGGTFEMGIDKADLKELVQMGRKVPHMDSLNAYWWFGDEIPRHAVKVDSFFIRIANRNGALADCFSNSLGLNLSGEGKIALGMVGGITSPKVTPGANSSKDAEAS